MARLRRLWTRLVRWWLRPAPPPERIGAAKPEKHRPIPIALDFSLHADGTVYHIPRDGTGVRRVRDEAVCALVYAEYEVLVRMARRRLRWRALFRRT